MNKKHRCSALVMFSFTTLVVFWLNIITYINRVEKKEHSEMELKGQQFTKRSKPLIYSYNGNRKQVFANMPPKPMVTTVPNTEDILTQNFNFTILSEGLCSKGPFDMEENWDLIVVVTCKGNNIRRRTAIRNTWGTDLEKVNSRLIFLVGRSDDDRVNNLLVGEAAKHNDIVHVNIAEYYTNLTFKSMSMLQWLASYCQKSRFYLKTDDDVYINIRNVMREFEQIDTKRFFLCHVFINSPVIRNQTSKYYVTRDEYSGEVYPDYCSGSAYGFPVSVLPDLYRAAFRTKVFQMEDIFITGILAKKSRVQHVHSPNFSVFRRRMDICAYKQASANHRISVRQSYEIFSLLRSANVTCS